MEIVHEKSWVILKRLLKDHVSPYKYKLFLSVLCMVLVAMTTVLTAWILKPALDEIFFKKDATMLALIPIAMIILYFIKGIAAYFQNYLMKKIGQRVVTDLQIQLYCHLIHSDLAFLSKNPSGKIISKFTNDINIMRGSVSSIITGISRELITVVALVILMFYLDPTLSLICFIVFPITVIPIIKLGRKMRGLAHMTQDEMGRYTAKLDDSFQSIRVIKSFRQEDHEISRAREIAEKIFKLYARSARTENIASPIMESIGGIAIAAVIWYGGMQIIEGVTTPGTFFAFIAAFMQAYKPMKSLSDMNQELQTGISAAARIFKIFDTKPKIQNNKNAKKLNLSQGEVKLEDVYFCYNNSKHKKALNGINLTIKPGTTVALVGPSGGGKSTISNLVTRFYDPEKGSILIDGQDLKYVKLNDIREAVTLVCQEVMLFDDSIFENIAFGKRGAVTKKEVMEAAKKAAAHEFIKQLPEGYDTQIGQNGLKLSGGQRQRISLARAFLKNSQIMVLDEATSALDPISERKIQDALIDLRKSKTNIIIAHRLSTIENADVICVINKGQIQEMGSHSELLKKNGLYKKLYNREHED